MTRCIVVLVTCPTRAVARRIASAVVTKRLAACVNVIPGIQSTFRWQGKIDRCREVLLIIKTTAPRLAALRRAVLSLHPYDVPEVIALPLVDGHPPYLTWVRRAVSRPASRP
ncbi:MAG: divalent-cation tolerance protein CutA [Candidatus Omnitrophica bacterium]|nr:divalent-cation tolerance protein CutA [Candidatus Omnitrophota bacterium]